ncbi:uncharacterized protein GIQ15_04311 [Arthroderma uncinatum]|uniref:uncharacterized protein n=1 Tax=Arthroderma uncinatum TaxID=74035 RepID=UPI00144AE4AB|nr:uncharacterized protein GIQ15_04311 [Arthroderma uncinatum]KAF3481552.1 hypothetical protein GIQ15_04311 [Arthroderma uncinatum]
MMARNTAELQIWRATRIYIRKLDAILSDEIIQLGILQLVYGRILPGKNPPRAAESSQALIAEIDESLALEASAESKWTNGRRPKPSRRLSSGHAGDISEARTAERGDGDVNAGGDGDSGSGDEADDGSEDARDDSGSEVTAEDPWSHPNTLPPFLSADCCRELELTGDSRASDARRGDHLNTAGSPITTSPWQGVSLGAGGGPPVEIDPLFVPQGPADYALSLAAGTIAMTPPPSDPQWPSFPGEINEFDINAFCDLDGPGPVADDVWDGVGASRGESPFSVASSRVSSHGGREDGSVQDVNFPLTNDVEGLLAVVRELYSKAAFELDWGVYTSGDIVAMLNCLRPEEWVSGALVNYFSRKLSSRENVRVLDSDWYSLDGESLPDIKPASVAPVLIPCFHLAHWSLIHVDPAGGQVTHYDSLAVGNGGHTAVGGGCCHCTKATSALAESLQRQGWTIPAWQFNAASCQWQSGADDCGVFMLWFMKCCAEGKLVPQPPPKNVRFELADEVVRDLRTCGKKQALRGVIGGSKRSFEYLECLTPGSQEGQDTLLDAGWEAYLVGWPHGSLLDEWRRLSTVQVNGQALGLNRARRLMQLAFNIASPEVFVGLKRSIVHLRQRGRQAPFGEDICGIYSSGVWHTKNEENSLVAMRLISWYIHDEVTRMCEGQSKRKGIVRKMIDRLGTSIYEGLPSPPSKLDVKQRIANWYRRGLEWSRLVCSFDDVNVLCLLPRDMNIVPDSKGIMSNEYRDLRAGECPELGKIVRFARPNFRQSIPKEVYGMFARAEIPRQRFNIELWSDQEIRDMPLDSDMFLRAFEWVDGAAEPA